MTSLCLLVFGVHKSYEPRGAILITCSHPGEDRIWTIQGVYNGSFKDHILSTLGWLYLEVGRLLVRSCTGSGSELSVSSGHLRVRMT